MPTFTSLGTKPVCRWHDLKFPLVLGQLFTLVADEAPVRAAGLAGNGTHVAARHAGERLESSRR
jgi:hypothetical protein